MGEHHPVGEVLQPHPAQQASQLFLLPVVHLGQEFLLIQIEPRVHVRGEHPVFQPLLQGTARLPVGVLPLGQLQAHYIVGVAGEQLLPLGGADDVVGRAGEGGDVPRPLLVVPQSLERPDLCHGANLLGCSVTLYCKRWGLSRQAAGAEV